MNINSEMEIFTMPVSRLAISFDGGNGVFQRVQHLNDVLKEKSVRPGSE